MSRSKGNRREREYGEILERAGYEVQPFRGTPYGETDGFGLYDLLAIRTSDEHGPVIRLVQVKSNEATGIREWASEAGHHSGVSIFPEYAVCTDRKGWRVMKPHFNGAVGGYTYRTVFDERERGCKMGEGVVDWLR